MPVTAYVDAVIERQFLHNFSTSAKVGPEWHRGKWRECCVRAAQGAGNVNSATPMSAHWRVYEAGVTGTREIRFRHSLMRMPAAPAGTYAVEWRSTWYNTSMACPPPRLYWDCRGNRSIPGTGKHLISRWPWNRDIADRLWNFGDPRLYSTFDWLTTPGFFSMFIPAASLKLRYHYR